MAKVSEIIENLSLLKRKQNASEAALNSSKNENLSMRFCSTVEVERQRNQFLIFKIKQLAKLQSAKENGQKQTLLNFTMEWIKDNLDELFDKFQGTEFMKEIEL